MVKQVQTDQIEGICSQFNMFLTKNQT